jgi:hypothetical protein
MPLQNSIPDRRQRSAGYCNKSTPASGMLVPGFDRAPEFCARWPNAAMSAERGEGVGAGFR